jgi:AcrR family transcriptional regulator
VSSRERLLEAAIDTIEEHGEAAVRVDEIALTAEVAKPSLYHFYGNREGLIAAAQAERYRRSLLVGYDEVVERLTKCTSRDEFLDIVRMWTSTFKTPEAVRRRAMRLDVLGSSVSRPALRKEIERANDEARAQLERFLEHARSKGWALTGTDIPTSDVAMWMHGLWNGRYLVDLTGETTQIEGWDRVTMRVLELLVFGSADD